MEMSDTNVDGAEQKIKTNERDKSMIEADNSDQPMYRVENGNNEHIGFSDDQQNAESMADEANRLVPDEAPHKVREVPKNEVHDDGRGTYPIVYTTNE